MMHKTTWYFAIVVVAVASGGLVLALSPERSNGADTNSTIARSSPSQPAVGERASSRQIPLAGEGSTKAGQGAAPQPLAADAERRRERRQQVDQLRQQLLRLYGSVDEPTKSAAPPGSAAAMPSPKGSGNQAREELGKYIQQVVRKEFYPVAGSCYEQLLERKPAAAGDVVLELSIVGNRDLGGVIERVEVNQERTTLADEEFITCVRESMYTTTFDAPPAGKNSVTVTYPFSFSP